MSLPLVIRHLDIVVEDETGQDHFNFICGIETTRTSVSTIAKSQVLFIRGSKLVAGDICGVASRTGLIGAEAIKGSRRRVEQFVLVDSHRGNFNHDAGGDILAVAESYALECAAGKRC